MFPVQRNMDLVFFQKVLVNLKKKLKEQKVPILLVIALLAVRLSNVFKINKVG